MQCQADVYVILIGLFGGSDFDPSELRVCTDWQQEEIRRWDGTGRLSTGGLFGVEVWPQQGGGGGGGGGGGVCMCV